MRRSFMFRRKISRLRARFREMLDNPKKYRFEDLFNLLKNYPGVEIAVVPNSVPKKAR